MQDRPECFRRPACGGLRIDRLSENAEYSPISEMPDALETELKTYEANKQKLLLDEGKFVLIHGKDILGVYETYEDALKVGYEKCKLQPFLVKQIQAVEQVYYFTRDLAAKCRT